MSFFKKIRNKVPVGRYTYRGEDKFAGMSLQLRIEQSGQGVMVINANTILHLNHTATALAYYFHAGLTSKRSCQKNSPTCTVSTLKQPKQTTKNLSTRLARWRKPKKLTQSLF